MTQQFGRTSANSPGVAENFERMQSHEIAFQQLLANPPPLPQPFTPPVTEAERDTAITLATERLAEITTQTLRELYRVKMGHIPEAQLIQIFSSHEPLYVPDPVSGAPLPNPWLASLMVNCAMLTADELGRYIRARARIEGHDEEAT